MSDLFQREHTNIVQPVTADKCTITWDGAIAAATNVSISYQQGVQRRRTIGNKQAVIWATYPSGQVTIQRLIADTASQIFGKAAWNACTPGQISFTLAGCGDAVCRICSWAWRISCVICLRIKKNRAVSTTTKTTTLTISKRMKGTEASPI